MSKALIKRRKFLGSFVLAMVSHPLLSKLALAKEDSSLMIRWYVPHEQSVEIQKSLEFKGKAIPDESSKEDARSPALIYILIGATALVILAETLLKVYKDWKYGGIIISKDKKGQLLIKNNLSLESGTIIIDQGKDVKVIFKEKDQPQAKDLIDALSGLVKK